MKTFQRIVFAVFITGIVLAGRRSWAQDNAAIQAANQDVQAAQNQLNHARQNYSDAVRTSGKDSPEAVSAKAKLDAAHDAWHAKMNNRRQLRKQVHGEMMQRHASGRKHSTAP